MHRRTLFVRQPLTTEKKRMAVFAVPRTRIISDPIHRAHIFMRMQFDWVVIVVDLTQCDTVREFFCEISRHS